MKLAKRMGNVAPYLFASMNAVKAQLRERGVDIVDMSIGDPDIPTPCHIIDRLCKAARNPENHRYPPYEGTMGFKSAVAAYYRKRFGVELDPRSEVMTLIGSKEGLAHLIWALVDEGKYALLPDPAYPVYDTQVGLAGGSAYKMPLREENGFLPVLEDIPSEVARNASIMFLNYPNNPTGAVATLDFFRQAAEFCKDYDIVLCHDAAYADIGFDGFVPPSVLQASKHQVVETYSLSKPFNMTGWRIAAIVGSADVIGKGIGIIKTNTDSGQFNAIQEAGEAALGEEPEKHIAANVATYQARRDVMVEALNKAGLRAEKPKGTFYLWVRVPQGETSASFAQKLLEKTAILVTPGSSYGKYGEGYVRMSLSVPTERVQEAARRLEATCLS